MILTDFSQPNPNPDHDMDPDPGGQKWYGSEMIQIWLLWKLIRELWPAQPPPSWTEPAQTSARSSESHTRPELDRCRCRNRGPGRLPAPGPSTCWAPPRTVCIWRLSWVGRWGGGPQPWHPRSSGEPRGTRGPANRCLQHWRRSQGSTTSFSVQDSVEMMGS